MFICLRSRLFQQALTNESTAPATEGVYNYIMIWNRLYEGRRIRLCQLAPSLSLKSLMYGSDLLIALWAEESPDVSWSWGKTRLFQQCLSILIFSILQFFVHSAVLGNLTVGAFSIPSSTEIGILVFITSLSPNCSNINLSQAQTHFWGPHTAWNDDADGQMSAKSEPNKTELATNLSHG